jgi:riboflavin synthase
MFTGIVEALGTVEGVPAPGTAGRLVITAPRSVADGLGQGDSLAVNGACLTVVETDGQRLGFDVSQESLAVTTLGQLAAGEAVNLERPLRIGDRLGGHLVLGHVDGVGHVVAAAAEGAGRRLTFEVPPVLRVLLIPKGSVAVDGVSLTVAGLQGNHFTVAVIPHTLEVTTLGRRQVGARVNLEMDVIGKYVRALCAGDPGEGAADRWVERWGCLAPGPASGRGA